MGDESCLCVAEIYAVTLLTPATTPWEPEALENEAWIETAERHFLTTNVGVVEFAFCLFFAKLVSYTFLYWLPTYIGRTSNLDSEAAADLSTAFDFGGIIGGILAGFISDTIGGRASVCAVLLTAATPMMFIYESFGRSQGMVVNVVLLLVVGMLVNGPYALITTAVSADLGTHPSLMGSARALATVTAIIDGTGSMGAALGPLLTGIISQSGWKNVFYMLIGADCCALLLLSRLVWQDCLMWRRGPIIQPTPQENRAENCVIQG